MVIGRRRDRLRLQLRYPPTDVTVTPNVENNGVEDDWEASEDEESGLKDSWDALSSDEEMLEPSKPVIEPAKAPPKGISVYTVRNCRA